MIYCKKKLYSSLRKTSFMSVDNSAKKESQYLEAHGSYTDGGEEFETLLTV